MILSRIRHGHGLALLIAAFWALSSPVAAQESDKIAEIVFEGKFRARPSYIQSNLMTKVGEAYSDEAVTADIKMIFERFRLRAEFIREPVTDGIRVVIRLIEDFPIKEIAFRGIKSSEEKELRKQLFLDDEALPDRYRLMSYQIKIRDYFRDKGFYFAEVNTVQKRVDDGVRLVFHVLKGDDVTVEKINFIGARKLDEDDLRSVMTLGEPTLWIFTDDLKDDVLKGDITLLNDYMRREGYLDGRITLDSLDFNDVYDEVEINILVQEGERFFVRDIEVKGTSAFTPEQVRELIHIKPGDPCREVKIDRDLNRIQNFYANRGYIRARVIGPERRYDERQPLVDLIFRVVEDEQKTIRDVVITGNTTTQDEVVRREITLYPGDIINQNEMGWSYDQLKGLQYFTNEMGAPAVDMRTQPVAEDPQLEDLLINVSEGGTGFFTFNVGVSTDTGLLAGVSVNKKNFDYADLPSSLWAAPGEFFTSDAFTGGGQTLRIEATPGTFNNRYGVFFFEPHFYDALPYPISLGMDLYSYSYDYSDYDERRLGFKPTFGKRWSRNLSTTLGFRSELIDLSSVEPDAPLEVKQLRGSTGIRSLIGTVSYRDVDRPFSTTSGYTTSLRYEYLGGFLGSDVDMSKAVVGANLFIPAFETESGAKHVILLRGSYGWAEEHGSTDNSPIFERYFAGGVSGSFPLRGFKYRGVGPHVLGDPVGGNVATAFGIEYSIPLISEYDPFFDTEDPRLKGVAFIDFGNVASDFHDSDLFGKLRRSYGVGLKISLPVLGGLPISLYYGIPWKKYPEDERRSFNISMNTNF